MRATSFWSLWRLCRCWCLFCCLLATHLSVCSFSPQGIGATHRARESGESALEPHHAEEQGPAFQPSLPRFPERMENFVTGYFGQGFGQLLLPSGGDARSARPRCLSAFTSATEDVCPVVTCLLFSLCPGFLFQATALFSGLSQDVSHKRFHLCRSLGLPVSQFVTSRVWFVRRCAMKGSNRSSQQHRPWKLYEFCSVLRARKTFFRVEDLPLDFNCRRESSPFLY